MTAAINAVIGIAVLAGYALVLGMVAAATWKVCDLFARYLRRPDPVDEPATAPTDPDAAHVAAEIADLEACLALPPYIREDQR